MRVTYSLLFLLFFSCNTANNIVRTNNYLINNIEKEGKRIYLPISFTSLGGGEVKDCSYERSLNKLNDHIPLETFIVSDDKDTFHLECEAYISYDYLKKLRSYVRKEAPKKLKKMDSISEQKYNSINFHTDSATLYYFGQ